MGIISNGTTLLDAGALDSGVATGSIIHIDTTTCSNVNTVSFTDNLDSTYKEYIFKFINIHPTGGSGSLSFLFQTNKNSQASDCAKQSTFFHPYADEGGTDGEAVLEYATGSDLANNAGEQRLFQGPADDDNDSGLSGVLHLYDPSNTTSMKHFLCVLQGALDVGGSPYTRCGFIEGYVNDTAAVDGVQFRFSAGNIGSGLIKRYGVK